MLVKVAAAGINPIDWKIREGWMSDRYGKEFPMVLGFDASGTIEKVGSAVQGLLPGDAVFARSDVGAGGCYAEYAALNANTVVHKPVGLSDEDAAAMPLAALTALNGLRDVGRIKPGHKVLINGASGGVGVYAVQIARNMGAEVTGVCSGGNMDLVRELGADAVIDYTRQDPLASGDTWDLIYDAVGTLKYLQARKYLTPAGVYMTLVPVADIDFFLPGQTHVVAQGGYFLVWAPTAADLQILADWVDEGRLYSIIDSSFALDEIQAAHERSQTERARGKIVVKMQS